jgi:hypothetical protein
MQMDATPLGKICISATLKPVVLGGAQPASDKTPLVRSEGRRRHRDDEATQST